MKKYQLCKVVYKPVVEVEREFLDYTEAKLHLVNANAVLAEKRDKEIPTINGHYEIRVMSATEKEAELIEVGTYRLIGKPRSSKVKNNGFILMESNDLDALVHMKALIDNSSNFSFKGHYIGKTFIEEVFGDTL